MDKSSGPEKREYVRLSSALPVRIKFLNLDGTPLSERILNGETTNISGGGLLIKAEVPETRMITGMLENKVALGIEVDIPEQAEPLRIIGRTSWLTIDEDDEARCFLGVTFREMTRECLDKIISFIVRACL